MITVFSPMRPFRGQVGDVQRNAIKSWLATGPGCEVVLVEDEEGTTAGAVRDLDVRVAAQVARSRLGAPLLGDLLTVGAQSSRGDILAYITADVLLPPNFVQVVKSCHAAMHGKPYFAVAGRVDLTQPEDFDFDSADWYRQVQDAIRRHGRPHGHSAADLWVYPKSMDLEAPPFPIGRCGTDNWAVYKMRSSGIPVIDLTTELLLVHQFHDRPAKRNPLFYEEQLECVYLFDNMAENAMSIIDADWLFEGGRIVRPRGLRRLHASMSLFRPYRMLMALQRKIRIPHLYRVDPTKPQQPTRS